MGGFKPPITVKALSPSCQAIPIKPISVVIVTRIFPRYFRPCILPPKGGSLEGGLYILSFMVSLLSCPVLTIIFLRITRGLCLVSTSPICLSCGRP